MCPWIDRQGQGGKAADGRRRFGRIEFLPPASCNRGPPSPPFVTSGGGGSSPARLCGLSSGGFLAAVLLPAADFLPPLHQSRGRHGPGGGVRGIEKTPPCRSVPFSPFRCVSANDVSVLPLGVVGRPRQGVFFAGSGLSAISIEAAARSTSMLAMAD